MAHEDGFDLIGLTPWKKRRDKFQNNDNVNNNLDQVDCFAEMESPGLTGSPTSVKFIKKDETNAQSMKDMHMRMWWR